MEPPPTSHPGAPPDPPFLSLPDELIEAIFHRLPAADHLARVSSACATFRRVIAGHTFLRHYRALHPPPLIGMHHKPFIFAQPPHPSAVPARAFADFDFSCSFLPSPAVGSWSKLDFFHGRDLVADAPVQDTSGKSILLASKVCDLQYQEFLVRDLAVCDPVHHRYVMLPAIPDGLKALVRRPDLLSLETFLAPGEDEEEDPFSFRVMCLAHCRMNLLLLVFSSSDGQWDAFTCDQWSARATGTSFVWSEPGLSSRRYANGCFYWHLHFLKKMLVFDARTMEFHAVDLPPGQHWPGEFVVVEATEGTLGILITVADEGNRDVCWLTYSILRNGKWHSEKVIPLPLKNASLLGVAGGYLLIETFYTTSLQEKPKCRYFSVDMKTLQVELFAEAALSKPIFSGLLFAGFPPSLCAPTL